MSHTNLLIKPQAVLQGLFNVFCVASRARCNATAPTELPAEDLAVAADSAGGERGNQRSRYHVLSYGYELTMKGH